MVGAQDCYQPLVMKQFPVIFSNESFGGRGNYFLVVFECNDLLTSLGSGFGWSAVVFYLAGVAKDVLGLG